MPIHDSDSASFPYLIPVGVMVYLVLFFVWYGLTALCDNCGSYYCMGCFICSETETSVDCPTESDECAQSARWMCCCPDLRCGCYCGYRVCSVPEECACRCFAPCRDACNQRWCCCCHCPRGHSPLLYDHTDEASMLCCHSCLPASDVPSGKYRGWYVTRQWEADSLPYLHLHKPTVSITTLDPDDLEEVTIMTETDV